MTAYVKTKVVGNMIAPPTRDVRGDPRMTGRFPTRTFHRTWSLSDAGAPPPPCLFLPLQPRPRPKGQRFTPGIGFALRRQTLTQKSGPLRCDATGLVFGEGGGVGGGGEHTLQMLQRLAHPR